MSAANQRITVLVTATERTRIAKLAKKTGLSMGEYMRRAAASYKPPDDDKMMSAMIDQMLKATDNAEKAIDEPRHMLDICQAVLYSWRLFASQVSRDGNYCKTFYQRSQSGGQNTQGFCLRGY